MYDDFSSSMKKADLKLRIDQYVNELAEDGCVLHPISSSKKNIAQSVWGKAWVKSLIQFDYYGLRLAPGRSLLRQGCVIDLKVEEGCVRAKIVAHELLDITLRVAPLCEEKQQDLQDLCSQSANSWISLVKGDIPENLLISLCDKDSGLFPLPDEWNAICPCDDWADVCSHAAAVLYALGVWLDDHPDSLFVLRGIDPRTLIPSVEKMDELQSSAEEDADWESIFQCNLS